MTKKELIQQLSRFPDSTIIAIEGENCPVPVTDIEEGSQIHDGKISTLIILTAEEPEEEDEDDH